MASDSTPLFITLAVGVLGWTLAHIVDRVESSRAVTYSIEHTSSGASSSIAITIKNIAEDKTFSDFTVVLAAPQGGSFTDAGILPVEPAFEGDEPWRLSGRTAQFTIPAIHPGWEFHIVGHYTGTGKAAVHFVAGNRGTIRAVKPSFETFLAESEPEILYALVGMWLMVLVAYFVLRPRTSTMDT